MEGELQELLNGAQRHLLVLEVDNVKFLPRAEWHLLGVLWSAMSSFRTGPSAPAGSSEGHQCQVSARWPRGAAVSWASARYVVIDGNIVQSCVSEVASSSVRIYVFQTFFGTLGGDSKRWIVKP